MRKVTFRALEGADYRIVRLSWRREADKLIVAKEEEDQTLENHLVPRLMKCAPKVS